MANMDSELVAKFVEVTGESEAVAQRYLSLADGNVEVAISLMFESGGRPPEPEPTEAETEEVRAPILPRQEILVPTVSAYSFPRLPNNVFDRFRDFAVETQRQEEEMARKMTGVKHVSQKKKRLEDLFRPPCNILFLGSFLEAREHAKSLNRWLLVNVQNPQEFSCQVLNRDVWPNQQIQEIVKDHFVLWQVLSNAADGKWYIDFYNVVEYPYLAIIDPRTGECMRTYNHITVETLITALTDMLSTHAAPDCAPEDGNAKEWSDSAPTKVPSVSILRDSTTSSSKPSKFSNDTGSSRKFTPDASSTSTAVSTSSVKIMNKRRKMEEPELEHQHLDDNPHESPVHTLKTDEKLKSGNEAAVKLCLRLPTGKKETISMFASDTIEDFLSKMDSMGYTLSEHSFLVPFPKTNIGELPSKTQLSDTILSPANTVFITKI